ncbi:hypothetical protein I3U40_18125 [Mycobacteroides abscessus subsp. abscessus]|uniref:hypothetical protein n=1 Tax=Mycobacteroides abscessus TaxID=36809 RepID=UPI0009A5674C|nr:hypothetical protein [Mycobacteroides abscessus]QSM92974.1 hypothetical protein I3U31_18115 [Mycobacteroides abscessus subsp. abscessus]QSM98012.1 hypothetical protein I3U40_18125 [Mycobacteroides abscessus subsp. abscessus]SLI41121.1 Uncharacterised protein [Mycobacteroides abscessus subsp. abscessus]
MTDADGSAPPQRESYTDIREFIRDHEAYWDSATPTDAAVLQRAARLGNDAMMAIRMQLDRIAAGPSQHGEDGYLAVFIDVDFLIAALWRMRQAGVLAKSRIGRWWAPLDTFDRALPDLKVMRDVSQHIAEYGIDGEWRKAINPRTGKPVGRRALEVRSLGDTFGWLGGDLDLTAADAASMTLLKAIRTVRDVEKR